VAIFALIVLFDIAAFFGGYLISLTSIHIPIGEFTSGIIQAFSTTDLVVLLIKSAVYGVLVPLICCYYGFKPTTSFQIPIFVSKAVVKTLLVIFIINAVLSVLFYL
jgi:phospholipid/cholesterol/gamma-HCH transport system permease protein